MVAQASSAWITAVREQLRPREHPVRGGLEERSVRLELGVAAVVELVPLLELELGLSHAGEVDGSGYQRIRACRVMLGGVPARHAAAGPRGGLPPQVGASGR